MVEYEREYLYWEQRQLALRQKYADTPSGLTARGSGEEEQRLRLAWENYEEGRRLRLTTATQLAEEPFVGRQVELAAIWKLFAEGAGSVFLSGMGGIGKSALARAYGRVYSGEYSQVLVWSYEKGIEQILMDDGQLGISNMTYTEDGYTSRKQYAREKYQKLVQIAGSQRILIILDNYNQMEDPWFEPLLEVPCDLLITTRFSGDLLADRGYAVVAVQGLQAEEEWREFYQVYTGKEPGGQDWEEIEAYRASVLGHTLRMKLAVCNPEQKGAAEKLANSILGNFKLKKAEIQILCELTYTILSGMPEEVYLSCTESTRESLDKLKRYSLIQVREGSGGRVFLSLHPVIDEAVQAAWHPDENRCVSFLQAYAYYIRHSWNRPREGDLWLMPQVLAILKRLPEQPAAWRFYIYECMATYLFVWEYFDEAEQIERKLYECVRAYYGEGHQYTAQMAMRLAAVYHCQMKFGESRGWYELGYQLYRKAKPVTEAYWADRAEACEKLARIYEHEEDYEAAFRYTEEAMEAANTFRKEVERTGSQIWMDRQMRIQYVYLRRARLYFGQGNIEAASRDLEKGLGLFPLNPNQQVEFRMLQIQIDLLRGAYEQARQAAVLDLDTMVYYQGESFKDSLSCREQLGDVLSCQGKLQEANREYIRVLDCLRERYPHQTAWMERLQQKLDGSEMKM